MLEGIATHRTRRIPIGQLRCAQCLKLLRRGGELQFCGDDLLHVFAFEKGMRSGPIPRSPTLIHTAHEAMRVGRGFCGNASLRQGPATHEGEPYTAV
ncbi:MAG TPA: hypothetical protein VHZ51_21555 [Ktedonobacteraceae bacterium]|nr:hypothetical protein [Ktedonobacteraceae bacterium]